MPGNIKRTQKEKDEQKLTTLIRESFNKVFYHDFSHKERVIIAIYDALKKQGKFATISYNNWEDALQVDINPKLLDEKKEIIQETGIRMAIKMHLFLIGKDPEETSEDYRKMSALYHVWNYGPYPESPQLWHVYGCSRCGKHLLVYSKKLPEKSPVVNSKTIWHKKNPNSESEKSHQGRYAYQGKILLENWELQEILHYMDVIKEKTDHGRNINPNYYYEDEW